MKGNKSVLILVVHVFGMFSVAVRTDFMVHHCGGTISLSQEQAGNLELRLTPADEYEAYSNCHVTVAVESDMRIHLVFLDMDINSFHHCPGDYLEVFDGIRNVTDKLFLFADHGGQKFCGHKVPKPMTSEHSNFTLRFISDATFHGKGFSLLLTAYHEGRCADNEYRCSNSRCFHKSLHCGDYNHCGDDSCSQASLLIVGAALSAFILLIAIIFLVIVLRYRCSKYVREDSYYDYCIDDVLPQLDQMSPESDVVEGTQSDPSANSRTLPSISIILVPSPSNFNP